MSGYKEAAHLIDGLLKEKNRSVAARWCDLKPQNETLKRGGVGR